MSSSLPPPLGELSLDTRLRARLRRYLLSGIIVSAPIASTVYLVWILVRFVDRRIQPLIPTRFHPETYLPEWLRPIGLPGLGVLIAVVILIFIGWLAGRLTGRFLLRLGEGALTSTPVVRSIYGAFKQISEAIFARKSGAFREVVLFEYPRRGTWAMGFLTGVTRGQVQNITADEVVNVFLPTTPNPTSGYLLFVPRREMITLDMTIEEGVKMIISGGIVTPPDRRPELKQERKQVGAAEGDRPTIG